MHVINYSSCNFALCELFFGTHPSQNAGDMCSFTCNFEFDVFDGCHQGILNLIREKSEFFCSALMMTGISSLRLDHQLI